MANVYIVSDDGIKAVVFNETELNKLKDYCNVTATKAFNDISEANVEVAKIALKRMEKKLKIND